MIIEIKDYKPEECRGCRFGESYDYRYVCYLLNKTKKPKKLYKHCPLRKKNRKYIKNAKDGFKMITDYLDRWIKEHKVYSAYIKKILRKFYSDLDKEMHKNLVEEWNEKKEKIVKEIEESSK